MNPLIGSTLKQHLISSARVVTNLFLVWVLLGAAWAFWQPSAFTWLKPYVGHGLGVIMFGMGITLTPADFQRVARQPFAVLIGVGAQYLVMPLVAVAVARALQLPADLAAGLILVGCCPGGTASNVMTYLARGDVALSVSLTTVSTLVAVLATPWLMQVLGGQYVPVDAAALMRSILLVVILPVLAGLLVHRYGGAAVETAIEVMPALAVVFIVLIVGCVVGLTRSKLVDSGGATLLAVMLHNLFGLAIGYGLARAARLDHIRARTLAIEVGMQNSGLGVVLALQHFAARPLVALPSAIFSVWHNISGPALAGYWRRLAR